MTNDNDLLSALRQIAELDTLVALLNEYKGVPIAGAATIQRLTEDGQLVVSVSPDQAVCLALARETTLQSALLSLAFKARVAHVSVRARSVVLADFVFTNYVPQARREIRVRPLNPVPATVRLEGQALTGDVLSIGFGGVGVFVPGHQISRELGAVLQRGLEAEVELSLPPYHDQCVLRGQLIYARLGPNACHLGFDLADDPHARPVLGAYAADRREAVLPELAELYEQMAREE